MKNHDLENDATGELDDDALESVAGGMESRARRPTALRTPTASKNTRVGGNLRTASSKNTRRTDNRDLKAKPSDARLRYANR